MLDVRDFGARGDGESVDTDAFRRAVDRARTGGGPVFLAADHTFVVDGPLFVPSGTVIRGDGLSSQVNFRPDAPSPSPPPGGHPGNGLFVVEEGNDVRFEDFHISCSSPLATDAIVFSNATSCVVSQVTIQGNGVGFTTAAIRITNHDNANSYGISLQADIAACAGDALRLDGPNSNAGIVVAPGSQLGQCNGHGIDTGVDGVCHELHAFGAVIQGSLQAQVSGSFDNAAFIGCHLENSTASQFAPVYIGAGQLFRSLQFVGCLVENAADQGNAGRYGLDIEPGSESTGLTVEGCLFPQAAAAAVHVDRVLGFRFANNTIHDGLEPLALGSSVSGVAFHLARSGQFGVRSSLPVRSVTGNYTPTLYDQVILLDVNAPVTIALPSAATINGGGDSYTVKNTALQQSQTTVVPHGSDTIDSETSLDLSGPFKTVTLLSDGSSWTVLSRL